MNKLEELIESDEYFVGCYSLMLPIKEQIKELAIAYAKICLEKAANEAVVFLPTHYGLHGTHNVDKQSITNIELP